MKLEELFEEMKKKQQELKLLMFNTNKKSGKPQNISYLSIIIDSYCISNIASTVLRLTKHNSIYRQKLYW